MAQTCDRTTTVKGPARLIVEKPGGGTFNIISRGDVTLTPVVETKPNTICGDIKQGKDSYVAHYWRLGFEPKGIKSYANCLLPYRTCTISQSVFEAAGDINITIIGNNGVSVQVFGAFVEQMPLVNLSLGTEIFEGSSVSFCIFGKNGVPLNEPGKFMRKFSSAPAGLDCGPVCLQSYSIVWNGGLWCPKGNTRVGLAAEIEKELVEGCGYVGATLKDVTATITTTLAGVDIDDMCEWLPLDGPELKPGQPLAGGATGDMQIIGECENFNFSFPDVSPKPTPFNWSCDNDRVADIEFESSIDKCAGVATVFNLVN